MNEPRITMNNNDVRLSEHFLLSEFLNADKYPDNKPTMQHVVNMTYGYLMLLLCQVPDPDVVQQMVYDGPVKKKNKRWMILFQNFFLSLQANRKIEKTE